ncbi:MAG: COQ9 family protein [Paracoccaceae bacterium]|nr:COQ9 family protein [Paracoccaceae bacterium]
MEELTLKEKLLDAALPHVAFDGWSPKVFRTAVEEVGADRGLAEAACPRGAVDLALAYHDRGDALMRAGLKTAEFADLRFRDKVAEALWIRLEVIDDKEAARRAATLFALPHHAGDSAKAVWQTADAVWTALGDASDDYNWYTKRATLSGVWAATVLYWLGDDSPGHVNTRAFIDRRIDDVMQIEKVKSEIRAAPIVGPLAQAAKNALAKVRPPMAVPRADLPGFWAGPRDGT